MRKPRQHQFFFEEELRNSQTYAWIRIVRAVSIPTPVRVAYSISFKKKLSDSERESFEKFVQNLYQTTSPYPKNQVICCWREWSLILVVF